MKSANRDGKLVLFAVDVLGPGRLLFSDCWRNDQIGYRARETRKL